MKRLLIISLMLALFLTACSGPFGFTSPSLKGDGTIPTTGISSLTRATDYSGLLELVRKAQRNMNEYPNRMYMTKGNLAGAEASQDASKDSPASGLSNYSQTNVQVAGVDEADIIKTDGRYLYLVANNRLYIVDAQDPSNMKVVSTRIFKMNQETETTSSGESPIEMYLDVASQRLILVSNCWQYEKMPMNPADVTYAEPGASSGSSSGSAGESGSAVTPASESGVSVDAKIAPDYYYNYNNKQYTTTRIYDLTDRSAPELVRQFSQDGYYISSRKIDNAVYVVTNQYQYRVYAETTAELKPEEVFPATCDTTDPSVVADWDTVPADSIAILPDGDISNQLILSAIDIADDGSKPDLLAVLGSAGMVYASAENLYVAAYTYEWDGKENSIPAYSTDIFRFRLAGAQISEAGKGSVPGYVLNQFSMDEYDGYFRIATTTGEVWTTEGVNVAKNNLYVLDSSLKIVGKVTGLAPGETIKSVRFMAAKAYVVTFRTTDPLFVIDLAEPAAPKVLGQLKIPGYSTYLHPYSDTMLLGFGYDVKTEGEFAYNMGIKVSLFDIADFNNPKELSTILLGGRGSYAAVLDNHKALLFSKEKNLIAFPATLTKTITNNPLEYGQPVFQGMLVLSVNADNKLVLDGQVTHFDKLSDPDGDPVTLDEKEMQAFYGYDMINRGAWIGDVLYTFSGREIRASNLADLAKIGQVELPGYEEFQQFYYGGDIMVKSGTGGLPAIMD